MSGEFVLVRWQVNFTSREGNLQSIKYARVVIGIKNVSKADIKLFFKLEIVSFLNICEYQF